MFDYIIDGGDCLFPRYCITNADRGDMSGTPSVSPEFLGRARQFRDRIAAADTNTSRLIDQITFPLARRRARHPTPRPEMLTDAVRMWRQGLEGVARLALTVEHGPKKLVVEELRVSASHYRRSDWDDHELGVALLRVELRVAHREFHADIIYLGAVGLHGLARRIQKGWSIGDAAILADLRALADAHALAQQVQGSQFSVPCRDGIWAGHVSEITSKNGEKRSILNARTYLPTGEIAR